MLVSVFVVVAIGQDNGLVDGKPSAYAPNPTAFLARISRPAYDVIGELLFLGLLTMILVSLGALVTRRRRAIGVERAQFTSLLYGGALTVVLIAGDGALPVGPGGRS